MASVTTPDGLKILQILKDISLILYGDGRELTEWLMFVGYPGYLIMSTVLKQ